MQNELPLPGLEPLGGTEGGMEVQKGSNGQGRIAKQQCFWGGGRTRDGADSMAENIQHVVFTRFL